MQPCFGSLVPQQHLKHCHFGDWSKVSELTSVTQSIAVFFLDKQLQTMQLLKRQNYSSCQYLSTFVSMFLNHFYQCIVTSVSAERLSHVPNHRISLTSVVNIIISKFLHHNVRKRQKVDADSFFISIEKEKNERKTERERKEAKEP